MCGIAGFFDQTIQKERGNEVLEQMLGCIARRGPDARGTYAHSGFYLGHNRLSIIDLSEVANQPLHRDGLSLIFNGEIYNYVELRRQLQAKGHVFRTESDTEVIMVAYLEYGRACVHYFVGMWAFALLDTRTGELFCSRDRFGIKPFYYASSGDRFAFASEQKAVCRFPGVEKTTDASMVASFLQLGMVDGVSRTFLEAVKALPAAHNLICKNGRIHTERYWELTPRADALILPEKEAVAEFEELLKQSVRIHCRSDVTVGACLSGGLDSSSLCALMAAGDPQQRVKAFHIYYTGEHGVDERFFAERVTEAYRGQLELHTFSPSDTEITRHFGDFMMNMGDPVASSGPYSQYFVMRLAAENGVKVVLDGQGADEYLAGYKHAVYRFLYDEIRRNGPVQAWKQFSDFARIRSVKGKEAMSYWLKTALMPFLSENGLYRFEYKYNMPHVALGDGLLSIEEGNFRDRLPKFLYHQLNQTSLNHLLYYEDRNSMRFSIESRVPFLDHRLPEFVLNHAPKLLIKDGWSKYLLRKSIAGYLPEQVTYRRDKKGFVTPGEVLWLNGPLREQLMEDKWDFPSETVNTRKAEQFRKDYLWGDRSRPSLVWRLALLSYWYRYVLPAL